MTYALTEVRGDKFAEELNRMNGAFPDSFLDLTQQQLDEGWWWLQTYDGVKVVGFSGMVPFHPFGEHYGYLKRTAILPEHTGRGLQKKMIQACMVKAKMATRWSHMVSETYFNNGASSNSFISEGFKLVSPERVWAKKTLFWKKEIER